MEIVPMLRIKTTRVIIITTKIGTIEDTISGINGLITTTKEMNRSTNNIPTTTSTTEAQTRTLILLPQTPLVQ